MMAWRYSRSEKIADAAVHAVGLVAAVVGIALLVARTAADGRMSDVAVASVYGLGLVAALGASFLYNAWPVSPLKWIFRRFDHSAIFVLIAATYTPFLAQLPLGPTAIALTTVVWGAALAGVVLKLGWPGQGDRLAILLYLAFGWSGLPAFSALSDALPSPTLSLIVAGGVIYSAGVIFHVWESLKFQNAIWHGFVVAGAAIHYAAVFHCLVGSRVT